MKIRYVVFGVSLLANVGLVTAFAFWPELAPASIRDVFESSAQRAARQKEEQHLADLAAAKRARIETARAADDQMKLWSKLDNGDLRALAQRLRAAGFPPAMVRAIVGEEIRRQFAERFKALSESANDLPYWKARPMRPDPKLIEQRNQLMRERMQLTRDVLGSDAESANTPATDRSRYGNLPPAKIEMLQRIEQDYADMTREVRDAMQGIYLPEDKDKLALLDREKQADLAAVLSPEELQDYEMRNSPITLRLRTALSYMDASEQEFRTIYQIEQQFDSQIHPTAATVGINTMESWQQREDAERQMNAQIVSALGPDRSTEFLRDSDFEYQRLARLAQQQSLPSDAAVQAYSLRNSTAAESVRIANDATMSVDEKRAELQTLAQNARAQLMSTLGPTAGQAYTASAPWLRAIEHGQSVTFTGSSTSFRSLPTPAPGH